MRIAVVLILALVSVQAWAAGCSETIENSDSIGQVKSKLLCLARERDAAINAAERLRIERDRERERSDSLRSELATSKASAEGAATRAGTPEIEITAFPWSQSQDSCLTKASQVMSNVGLSVSTQAIVAEGYGNDQRFMIWCQSPRYMIIGIGPKGSKPRAMVNRIAASF